MHNKCMNISNFSHIAIALGNEARTLGISQLDISHATGINQSQISRIFNGDLKRESKAYKAITNFIQMHRKGVTRVSVIENRELIDALASVWDGSPEQAVALATIIKALGKLGHTKLERLEGSYAES